MVTLKPSSNAGGKYLKELVSWISSLSFNLVKCQENGTNGQIITISFIFHSMSKMYISYWKDSMCRNWWSGLSIGTQARDISSFSFNIFAIILTQMIDCYD